MGLDLALLPAFNVSHDVLQMERDYLIFDEISKIENSKGIDCPTGGFQSYMGRDKSEKWEEHCYSKTEKTPYGNRIKSLSAKELLDILSKFEISDWRNKAVLEYLKNCPKNLPIYLYWH